GRSSEVRDGTTDEAINAKAPRERRGTKCQSLTGALSSVHRVTGIRRADWNRPGLMNAHAPLADSRGFSLRRTAATLLRSEPKQSLASAAPTESPACDYRMPSR